MLNQDPWWRSRVLPLFLYDSENPNGRPVGLGTTFRIDPFGSCATAFHVIEHLLLVGANGVEVDSSHSLLALDMPEGAYMMGRVGIPSSWWRRLESIFCFPVSKEQSPLIHIPARVRNTSELACLGFSPLIENAAPYLPVRMRGNLPSIGETLTAYGFADLDLGKREDDAISQYLYQHSGQVVEVIPSERASTRPWPKVVVEGRWPPGMSGGPILNERGEVVGVVSTGIEGSDISVGHIFAGWNVPEMNFTTLDASNPGHFWGFAAIDSNGSLRFFGHVEKEVQDFATSHGLETKFVSLHHKSGGWLSSSV